MGSESRKLKRSLQKKRYERFCESFTEIMDKRRTANKEFVDDNKSKDDVVMKKPTFRQWKEFVDKQEKFIKRAIEDAKKKQAEQLVEDIDLDWKETAVGEKIKAAGEKARDEIPYVALETELAKDLL